MTVVGAHWHGVAGREMGCTACKLESRADHCAGDAGAAAEVTDPEIASRYGTRALERTGLMDFKRWDDCGQQIGSVVAVGEAADGDVEKEVTGVADCSGVLQAVSVGVEVDRN